jgi:hypothetical protein
MSFNSFVNIFTNSPIQPTDVSYLNLTFNGGNENVQLEWVFQNPSTLYPFTQFIQVNGTGTNTYTITMPNALYSSTIQSTIIYNQGVEAVTLLNFEGVTIGICDPGLAYFAGNTDNTTSGGNWNVFLTLGAGSSSVIASDLIDPTSNSSSPPESNSGGLGAFGAYLKLNTKVYTYSGTDYIGNPSDRGTIVTWTAGSGNYIFDLSTTVGNGFITGLQNRSTTGGVVSVYTTAPDLLNDEADSNTSLPSVIQLQSGESTFFISDGDGNWFTFAYSSNAQYAIQNISYSLATSGGTVTVSTSDAANQIQTFQGTYGSSPYPNVDVTFPASLVQQYFINNLSTTNSLSVSILNETNPTYIYTVLPGAAITTFTDGTHLYLSPNIIINEIIYLPNGTAGAPSLTFTNDTNTGLYLDTTNSCLGVTNNGTEVVAFKAAGSLYFSPIIVPTNTISYTFNGHLTSGIQYTTSTSTIDTYVGGTVVTSISSSLITLNVEVNTPTYSYQQAGINIYSVMRAYGF